MLEVPFFNDLTPARSCALLVRYLVRRSILKPGGFRFPVQRSFRIESPQRG